jgi:hypothetical protein
MTWWLARSAPRDRAYPDYRDQFAGLLTRP